MDADGCDVGRLLQQGVLHARHIQAVGAVLVILGGVRRDDGEDRGLLRQGADEAAAAGVDVVKDIAAGVHDAKLRGIVPGAAGGQPDGDSAAGGGARPIGDLGALQALQRVARIIPDPHLQVALVDLWLMVLVVVLRQGAVQALTHLSGEAQVEVQGLGALADVVCLAVHHQVAQGIGARGGEAAAARPDPAVAVRVQLRVHGVAVGMGEYRLEPLGPEGIIRKADLRRHGLLIGAIHGVVGLFVVHAAPGHGIHREASHHYLGGLRHPVVHAVHADIVQVVGARGGEGVAGRPAGGLVALLLLGEGHLRALAGALLGIDLPDEEAGHLLGLAAGDMDLHLGGHVRIGFVCKLALVHLRRYIAGGHLQVAVTQGAQRLRGAELEVQLALDVPGGEHILVGEVGAVQVEDGGEVLLPIRIEHGDGPAQLGVAAGVAFAQGLGGFRRIGGFRGIAGDGHAVHGAEHQGNGHTAVEGIVILRVHHRRGQQHAALGVHEGHLHAAQQPQGALQLLR